MTAPISNILAEKAVLGALLRSPTTFWSINNVLRPDHFSNTNHQLIYSGIRDICMEGKPLSLTLLTARLPEEDSAGKSMKAYLSVLLANAEDSGGAIDYVGEVVETWGRRKLIEIAAAVGKEATSGTKAVADVIADMSAKVMDVTNGTDATPEKPLAEVLNRVVTQSASAFQDEGFVPGFDTGLPSLDELCGRIMPGDLVFICGSQGDGKTALLVQILERIAAQSPALLFEMEMQDTDIGRRMLAGESDLSSAEIEEGALDFASFERLRDAQDRLSKQRLFIDDRPRLRVGQIKNKCLAVKNSRGLGAVAIDHLRLAQPDIKCRDIFERIEHISGSFKSLAKELKVPVICLAQRTKGSQDRDDPQPRITDIYGGGFIEQDADTILGVWRRDIWLRQREPRVAEGKAHDDWVKDYQRAKGVIEVIALKRRRGAALEKRRFNFNGRATRLEEMQ